MNLIANQGVGGLSDGVTQIYGGTILYKSSDGSVTINVDAANREINFVVPGGGGGGSTYKTERITLSAEDIANKYVVLTLAPVLKVDTRLEVLGGIEQKYTTDYEVTSDDSDKRLSWDGKGLEALLIEGDAIVVSYN